MSRYSIPIFQAEPRSFKSVTYIILCFLFIAFTTTGCHSTRIISASKLKLKQDFCVSSSTIDYSQLQAILENTDSLIDKETELNKFFTKQDILIANASGTLQLIKDIIRVGTDTTKFNEKRFLAYTIGIQKNIFRTKSQIDAVSAELQCETFRIQQLSSYLGSLNAKVNSKLTVGAIVIGSLTTILPVFIKGKTPQNVVTISGGIISVGMGVMTLKPGSYKLKLMTYRNLLENIWYGNTVPVIYPPGVWYFLNEPAFGNAQGSSKAKFIKTRWLKFNLNNSLDKETEELLFADGGTFNQDNLDLRATMLSELVAEINSMNQYLDNLSYKIDDVKLHTLQHQ